MRPDPHILTDALNRLCRARKLEVEHQEGLGYFYYIRTYFDPSNPHHQQRKLLVLTLHEKFRKLNTKKYCGDALETVVWTAIDNAGNLTPFGSQRKPVDSFGRIQLSGSLDFILITQNPLGYLVAGEAKNIRPWIYPGSPELREFILKVLQLSKTNHPIVPVFIARKIHYSTFLLFSYLGILGYQTHRQYFMPDVASELEEIKHKDGLGYHDITTDLTPPVSLENFFKSTLPRRAEAVAERFQKNRELLEAVLSKKFDLSDLLQLSDDDLTA